MPDENQNGLTAHDIDAMHRQADLTPFPCLLRAAMDELRDSRTLRQRLAAVEALLNDAQDAISRRQCRNAGVIPSDVYGEPPKGRDFDSWSAERDVNDAEFLADTLINAADALKAAIDGRGE